MMCVRTVMSSPLSRRMRDSIALVVVFPWVPATAMTSAEGGREAERAQRNHRSAEDCCLCPSAPAPRKDGRNGAWAGWGPSLLVSQSATAASTC